ncbi:hypothetical protein [Pseudomonas japonica]|uniref:hypothetical protein n=1 Tax=Pseudomonas japonica TaxID=256466 RepID=UPI0015E41E60|nr:hypothetical protein [Pseudomonas japonica]MBA1290253.1 hypothetical protein [Pseudomonas japonica]
MKQSVFKVIRLVLSGALVGVVTTNVVGGHVEGLTEVVGGVIGAGSAVALMKLSLLA